MCGIVGYIGQRRAVPVILEGLKRLEYRGYDSAGLAYPQEGKIVKHRSQGKLINLEESLEEVGDLTCRVGLGHTRWATHGAPSTANAHPHSDCKDELVVVHNGIIENYSTLRDELKMAGHEFTSDTDTEVIAHLIEEYLQDDLMEAVRQALRRVEGAYALGIIWAKEPERIVAVRHHSPLVLGIQEGKGCFLASDIPAILPYTNSVVFLEDQEAAVLEKDGCWQVTKLFSGSPLTKEVKVIDWNAGMAEKAGYKHFMLKEIFEQPLAILDTIRGRLDPESGLVDLPEIELSLEEIRGLKRIFLVACGTSWHAALTAKYWLEKWVGIPVEVDIASEFRYRSLLLDEKVLVVPISQSGETADTLAGLRLAKEMGARVISICNVVGSTITRESEGTVYTHAGPEIGVASTKAFTSQLTALFLLTMFLGRSREVMDQERAKELGRALIDLPNIIETELPKLQEAANEVAAHFVQSRDFLYLGRGVNFPIALEGALKLKEISYIHAEGYASGELKHGPIALIDDDMPVLALVPPDHLYKKVVSNVEEVKARKGTMILVGERGDDQLERIADYLLDVPSVHPELHPLLYVIPLQLLAYQIASLRGCDVDQPRNLAKSVTVE